MNRILIGLLAGGAIYLASRKAPAAAAGAAAEKTADDTVGLPPADEQTGGTGGGDTSGTSQGTTGGQSSEPASQPTYDQEPTPQATSGLVPGLKQPVGAGPALPAVFKSTITGAPAITQAPAFTAAPVVLPPPRPVTRPARDAVVARTLPPSGLRRPERAPRLSIERPAAPARFAPARAADPVQAPAVPAVPMGRGAPTQQIGLRGLHVREE
jgi:hypothetical protein